MTETLYSQKKIRHSLNCFVFVVRLPTFLPIGKQERSVVINVSLGRHNFLSSAHFSEQHSFDFSHF